MATQKTPSPTKLVFVIPELDTATSGHYWHVYELLQEVGKKIQVALIAETGVTMPPQGRLHTLIASQRTTYLSSLIVRMWSFFVLNLEGYRVFYIHQSYGSALLAKLIGYCFGSKVLYWHCGQLHIYEESSGHKNWLFRLNLHLIDYLVTAHTGMKNYYHRHYYIPKRKIKLLPGWINCKRFAQLDTKKIQHLQQWLKLEGHRVILFVHWLSPRKGSRHLPKIIEKTLTKMPKTIFVIVGDGPDFLWLKRKLQEQNLTHAVRLIGAVPNAKLPEYFGLADVFIIPSREEELGRVQLEAMAAGVPMVGFQTLSSTYLLSPLQNQLYVPQGNANAFVNAIGTALGEQPVYSAENLRQAATFSLSEVALTYIKLILTTAAK